MYQLKDFLIVQDRTLRDALKAIEKNRRGFVAVVDDDGRMVGTLTDGDVRRKLLDGADLDEKIVDSKAYRRDFTSVSDTAIVDELVEVFKNEGITFVPFLDADGKPVGFITRGQLYGLVLQCADLPAFDELLNVDEHLMDFEIFQRPWGIYKTTVLQDDYQSKVLQIRPAAQLSLQYHLHREEYWTVVCGRGVAQVGDSHFPVQAGSTIFIPRGCKHRMTNSSDYSQLVILEAQIGDYFGEDDIVRLEDRYGRVKKSEKSKK
ncbi:MAG: CBS domain-containing protein [Eggerthellaceae bacterium]|jgi:mannose-1-phosphate guanylyltransferase/mannose-6-phosphate isomerase